MRRFLSIFGSLLTVTGIGLLILTVLLQYSGESKRNHLQQTVTAEETPSAGVSEELPSATATALPPQPPAPKPWKPNRIRIPKIDVDSPVVEAPLVNGRWQIPKFAAGHLERTAYPGEIGNVAMTGHLDGYDNSNVFARLRELSVGDGIVLLGENNLATYIVSESKVVKRDDMSVIEGTTEPVLTLITCAGIWNPLIGEYNERLVIVAKLTKQTTY